MAKVQGLSKRGGAWPFRVRVPGHLRTEIKKTEITKILGVVSHAKAARLARIERHNADQLFAEAEVRIRAAPAETLSESQLHHLARAFFYRLEAQATPVPIDDGRRESLADAACDDLFGVSQSFDDSAIQAIATKFVGSPNTLLSSSRCQ